MRYFSRILLLTILLLFTEKKERIYNLPFDIPGSQMAATIPPFGIFIEEEYREEGDGPGSILRHERVHWEQYRRMGLIGFYYSYMSEHIKHGRIRHSLEEEARRLSK